MSFLKWFAGSWLFLCVFLLGFMAFVTGGGISGFVELVKTFGALTALLCFLPAIMIAAQQNLPLK